jgi:DNA-binding CsgD family transcriptional regulator
MAKSAAARAEARFKQLCSLGLGGDMVIPALLKEIHSLVPSSGSSFFVADEKGALANKYCDCTTPALDRLYFEQVYCRLDSGYAFPDIIRTQPGVHDTAEIMALIGRDMKAWRNSIHYDLCFRPRRLDFVLRLVIQDHRDERGIGMLSLYRKPGERWFSPEEKGRLLGLETFLAHALAGPTKSDPPLVDSGRSGLIVANADGRLIQISAEGRQLLYLATHPRIAPDTDFSRAEMLPVPLVRLCKDLARIFFDDSSVSAPVYHCRNVWGGFTFRAHWLKGEDPASGLVGIAVSHEEPLAVKLVRHAGRLPLSRRQAEVCVLMASGASTQKIAERLGISKHTAIAHGRWIYDKLDVHSRAELVDKLLVS